MNNTIDRVAVYGTLKKGFSNHRMMTLARGEYQWKDYVQFNKMGTCWFPMLKFSKNSNKWLEVEIYNVPITGIEWPLDGLEWYVPNSEYNLYNRIKVETKSGKKVWVYEIEEDIEDVSDNYFIEKKNNDLLYIWN